MQCDTGGDCVCACVCVCVCVCVCGLMQQKLISCSYKVHYRLEDSLEKIPLPSVGA